MLIVKNLSSRYEKVKVLNDISLEVKEGDILGLLGRNGAGKSTLLKSIMGLVEIVSGKISLDEKILSGKKAEEIPHFGIGYVPQGRRLFPELMVEENLKMGLLVRDNSEEVLDWVLSLFPALKSRLKQISGTLSGGEQQMVPARTRLRPGQGRPAARRTYGPRAKTAGTADHDHNRRNRRALVYPVPVPVGQRRPHGIRRRGRLHGLPDGRYEVGNIRERMGPPAGHSGRHS